MIKVILISSVKPNPSSAGEAVLNRHLVNEPNIDLLLIECEPGKSGVRQFLRKSLARVSRTIFRRYVADVMALWQGRWIDAELAVPVDTQVPTVVMTTAHGDAYYAAMRYAKRHNLPLVTFFHDWWPSISRVHSPFRSLLERSFRELYRQTALPLCVSHGMRQSLGAHPNSKVLLPIPAMANQLEKIHAHQADVTYRVLYAGNLTEYGPMLMSALEDLSDSSEIRLEIRGNSSSWPEMIRTPMFDRGLLLPFVRRDELNDWLDSADAFLITQSFNVKDELLMKTNFPSKLVEFAQMGKPLIIWGPSYASASVWAKESGQALVINQENPECLRVALEELSKNKAEQMRLAAGAVDAASGPFNPERIQSDFLQWLGEVAV